LIAKQNNKMSYTDDYQKEQARRIARGEPLSNQEVVKNLDSAKQHILERGAQHESEGSEAMAQDVAGLVDKGKVFVQEKNPNQELQKLQHAGMKFGKHAPSGGNMGSVQQQYFDQMKERYDDLAELATKMAYSRGTRRIMRRIQTIVFESLSTAAGQGEQKLQSAARQSENKENAGDYSSGWSGQGVHDPNLFEGASGTHRESGSGFGQQSGFGQGSGSGFGQGLGSEFGQGSGSEFRQGSGFGQGSGSEFRQGSGFGQGSGSEFRQDTGSEFRQGAGSGFGQGSGSEFGQDSGSHDIIQQDTKHTRKNYKVIIRGQEFDFLKDDMSQENKDWVAEEAQNICIDVASDEQLKDSASAFCRILKSTSQMNVEKPKLSDEASRALEESKTHLKSLLDHMAEGYDICRMEKAWHGFLDKTKRNEEMEHDWKDFFSFLKESFLSKRLAMSHDWTDNFTQKIDRLRSHLLSIKPELFNLLQEFDCFAQALKDDRFISETSASVDKLNKDLFLDKNGNFEFKPEALKQIRDIIIPEFIEQFKYIAIPTFRDEDDAHSSEISNAVFKSEGLSPDDVQIQNTTDIKFTRKDDNVFRTSIHVLIRGMNFDIQDMHVKYQRKVFPQLTDEGNFNIRSTGKGVNLEMWLSASAEDAEIFKVDDVDCTISGLRIYDSHVKQYTFLFTVFKPLLQTMMRKQVEKAVEEKIKQSLFSLKGLKGLQK